MTDNDQEQPLLNEEIINYPTQEEQDLYKFCYEEDGYSLQWNQSEQEGEDDNYGHLKDEDESVLNNQFYGRYYIDEDYDDGNERAYQEDHLHDFDYEDRIFGNSGKQHHYSGTEKAKKGSRGSRGSSGGGSSGSGLNGTIPLKRQNSKSEENLKSFDRKRNNKNIDNSNNGSSKNSLQKKHSVLELVEASKQTNYWSVFDQSYQGVLEYGVVIKSFAGNQFLIFCGFQNVTGVTLNGFPYHYKKIEEGDVVVYQTIDSNFAFNLTKVYISANCEPDEIEILYRRGELSPQLYRFHKMIIDQSKNVLTSKKGNSLQEFLYSCQDRNYSKFHLADEHKQGSLATLSAPAEASTIELKELYHFNKIILEKIIDYFIDYLQKQRQMKAMIVKMTTDTIRATSSLNSIPNTNDSVDTFSESDISKPLKKTSQKIVKSKSKVGILLFLFFLESIHHILYQLPAIRIDQSYQTRSNYNREVENLKLQEIYRFSIYSYNMNNCFGKLIRLLFQQILLYLCQNNPIAMSSPSSPEKNNITASVNLNSLSFENIPIIEEHPTGPIRTTSQELYLRMVERLCHMDIIVNILPFLCFEDIYQCLFLLFPQSIHHYHLYQHSTSNTQQNPTPVSLSSPSAPSVVTTGRSIFGNLENLKIIIQHFFHEININTYHIGIANDIYDIFSCNINWEQFLKRLHTTMSHNERFSTDREWKR